MDTLRMALFLALKNTFSSVNLLLLVVSIIAVGFANSLFLSGVFGGMSESMISGLIANTYSNIIIEPYEDQEYIDNAEAVLKKIDSLPGVEAAARRIVLGGTIIKGDRHVAAVAILGVDPERELGISGLPERVPDGEYLEPRDSGEILLGASLANTQFQKFMDEETTIGAVSGDSVGVVFNNGARKEYHVKGVFVSKALLADHMAIIPIGEAEEAAGMKDIASQILVKVPRGEEGQYIQKLRLLGVSGRIVTWKERAGFVNFIMETFRIIEAMVTVFSLATVAIAIFIVLYIQVSNRRKQIGILKAIGIDEQVVLFAYVVQSLIYAVFGIVFGVLLFMAIAYYFSRNPLDTALGYVVLYLEPQRLLINSALVLPISVIGGLVPAYGASRANIIRAIWG